MPMRIFTTTLSEEIRKIPLGLQLIGRVLAKNQFGIADGFIAQRIQQMIESGELKVISSNSTLCDCISKGDLLVCT